MRPCSLTMVAFGPFQGSETINFEQLGENPLFLINGPTGSGKTTLLDAICFALYGRTTGDEREGSQMRCDHAPDDLLTEVEFSFELAACRYRIRRVPEQQRPKARGEGTTTQAAEAQLWRVDSSGSDQLIVAGKVTEATREIEQLTGLSVEQFRQVMVLPQGKFRDLLLAESKAREAIFSQLFQTRIYRQLEEQLKFRSAGIRREVEKSRQIQQGILEGIGLEHKQDLLDGLQQMQPEVEQAKQQKLDAENAHADALHKVQQAQTVSEGFHRLGVLKEQQAALERQRADIQLKQRRLQVAEQADQLSPLFEARERNRRDYLLVETKSLQASQLLSDAKKRLDQSLIEVHKAEQLTVSLDVAKQQLSTLKGYQARALILQQAQATLQQALAAEQTLNTTQQNYAVQLQEQLEACEKSQCEQSRLQQSIAHLSDTPLHHQQVANMLKERRLLDEMIMQRGEKRRQLDKAGQEGRQLASEHAALLEQSKKLELTWHRGQAALLASELESDQPCPVCGSTIHPTPAVSAGEIPGEEMLEKARRAVQDAQDNLIKAREAYAHIKSSLESLDVQISKQHVALEDAKEQSAEQLQERHDELQQQVEQLKLNQLAHQELKTAEQPLQQRITELRNNLDQVNKQLTGQHAAVAAARSQLQGAEQELPALYRETGALQSALEQVQATIERLTNDITAARKLYQDANGAWEATKATAQSADEQKAARLTAMQSAEAQWLVALEESDFKDEADFHRALIDTPEKQLIKQQVSEFEATVQQVAGALQQQQSLLDGHTPPDLVALQLVLERRAKLRTDAETAWHSVDKRLGQLQAAADKLQGIEQQCEVLEKDYALIGTLSDVANGQTGEKISLQRFVLSVLLDDVLVEASHRLHQMTKGRYQLLRKEEKAKGNRASGLDLQVEDAYSGKSRPVATLSGGESFLAALSLALGLSDVVQAYSGGIRLDTLFIDEGFGSLDQESLDLAIRTLIDLQASGRMIGVISHVTELKEQMPLRLDITSGRGGSHVTLVRP